LAKAKSRLHRQPVLVESLLRLSLRLLTARLRGPGASRCRGFSIVVSLPTRLCRTSAQGKSSGGRLLAHSIVHLRCQDRFTFIVDSGNSTRMTRSRPRTSVAASLKGASSNGLGLQLDRRHRYSRRAPRTRRWRSARTRLCLLPRCQPGSRSGFYLINFFDRA